MISFDKELLKDINKDWGHEEGDFALQVFSSALKTTLEEDVILARTGDDEFSVLLPGLEKADAKEYISLLSFKLYALTVFCRRYSQRRLEYLHEMFLILIAYRLTDLVDTHIRGLQQALGFLHTQIL